MITINNVYGRKDVIFLKNRKGFLENLVKYKVMMNITDLINQIILKRNAD